MENLRWILIFAGVAILLLLWFSGRAGRRAPGSSGAPDPLLGESRADDLDERFDTITLDERAFDRVSFDGDGAIDRIVVDERDDAFEDIAPDVAPRGRRSPGVGRSASRAENAPPHEEMAVDEPPVARSAVFDGTRDDAPGGRPLEIDPPPPTALGGLAQKFEAIGERLAPRRRQRVAESEPEEADEEGGKSYATKIVTLHVVAPEGAILPPEALYEMFERRGYHHGDMSIYHSVYEGRTVFSIARMVKPGTFDPDDLSTFETPGLALILQLPGPVAADTAFEVMLSEAFEIAGELGGSVLDANRSTLGRQTEQHLREGIYEYMHRQKYFDSVV